METIKDGKSITGEVHRYIMRSSDGRVPNGVIPGTHKPGEGKRGGRQVFGYVDYGRELTADEQTAYSLEPLEVNVVYILHFIKPLARPKNNTCACHYSGTTTLDRLYERLREHKRGQGARITAAEMLQGGDLILTGYIEISKQQAERHRFEKKFKRRKNTARYCLLCRAAKAAHKLAAQRAAEQTAGRGLATASPDAALTAIPEPLPVAGGQSSGYVM